MHHTAGTRPDRPEGSARPLAVAEVIGKICGGGVENFVFQYLREIVSHDQPAIRFTVFYTTDSTKEPPSDLRDAGVGFIAYPPRTRPWSQYRFLTRQFAAGGYDIVHAHLTSLSAPAIDAAKKSGVRVRILHSHTTVSGDALPRRMLKRLLAPLARRNATSLASCSPAASESLYTRRQIRDGKVMLLPNAVDFSRFAAAPDAAADTMSGGRKERTKVLSLIGRLEHQKNPLFVVPVFSRLSKEDPSWRLHIVGDGSLRAAMTDALRKAGLLGKTTFTGIVSSAAPYYRASSAVIMPSLFEGLPFTAIEAQASGVPVVCSTAVPVQARISTGFVCLGLDDPPDSWARTIISVTRRPPHLLPQAQEFDITHAAPRLVSWYEELLSSEDGL